MNTKSLEIRHKAAEIIAEVTYGHTRAKAIDWAKEDKFDSCFREGLDILYALEQSGFSLLDIQRVTEIFQCA